MTEEEKAMYKERYGDPSYNGPEQGNHLFKIIVSHITQNVKELPITCVIPFLKVISDTRMDKSDVKEQHLLILE
jgi:hypothetical protein